MVSGGLPRAVWDRIVVPRSSSRTSGLVPKRRLSSTNVGARPVGPPKSRVPAGPWRKVPMPIVAGAGTVVYFFSGRTTVVSVLPSLISRTEPASSSI